MIENCSLNTILSNVVGLPVAGCACALLEHGIIKVRKTGAQGSKP